MRVKQDKDDKLAALAMEASVEAAERGREPCSLAGSLPLYDSVLPGGRRVRLLKVLQTNVCSLDCRYCAQRAGMTGPRTSLSPDELARAFDDLVHRGLAGGLFLSSSIPGDPVSAMDRILATAELVRKRYGFKGYVHLKVLPGAEKAQVEAAAWLADRLSINLEAPSESRLEGIAPGKNFGSDIMERAEWIALAVRRAGRRVSQTTQLVVGAGEESDLEVLQAAQLVYSRLGLSRVYYSGFRPVEGTPLEGRPAVPRSRVTRLYQADVLIREYGFTARDLVFRNDHNLHEDKDPKLAWALSHPELFPVEVNSAEPEVLLKVPGIGPSACARILEERRKGKIRSPAQVAGLGAARRSLDFLLLDGKSFRSRRQMDLFRDTP